MAIWLIESSLLVSHIKFNVDIISRSYSQVVICLGYGTQETTKKAKSETSKKRKYSYEDDVDDEEDSKDWYAYCRQIYFFEHLLFSISVFLSDLLT